MRVEELEPGRASFADLLGEAKDASAGAQSVVRIAPVILAAHLFSSLVLIFAVELAAAQRPLMILAIGATLVLDLLLLLARTKRDFLSAHSGVQLCLLCGYGGAVGAAWAAALLSVGGAGIVEITPVSGAALIGAFVITAMALMSFPAASITHSLSFVIGVSLAAGSILVTAILLGAVALAGAVMAAKAAIHRASHKEHERAELPMVQATRLLREFEGSGRGWFWETDAEGNLTYLSSAIADRLGLTPEATIQTQLPSLVVHEPAGTGGQATERTIGFHLSARTPFQDIIVGAAALQDVWWSLSGRPSFDDAGRFRGFRGSGTDLSEARRADAEITRLAHFDALTGLPNRLLMRNTLRDGLTAGAERRQDCALFLLDLDRFKSVNDTLGHPVGDKLLQQVAQRLVQAVGTRGRVGRLGGDEFNVVVTKVTEKEQLAALADTIIARLSYPYTIDDSTISIGASVGIALSPFDGDCPDELVRNADLALYAAKEAGKGVHRFYQPQMHSKARERQLLEGDLREALGAKQLHLMYQPIIDLETEQIVAFEALLRWEHPKRGAIPPSDFIPIAEEINIIPQIGEWVLRTACREAARWPKHIRVAVNLSPLQFASSDLPTLVGDALAEADLAAGRLELELTESVLLNESASTDAMFVALKELGVRLALDDFGTGYASLANLKRVPFDKIKIDQSFVRSAPIDDSRNTAIIKSTVALADALGMDTTAEGAESLADVERIRTLGCTQVQGYIFGLPMPPEEALAKALTSAAQWANREERDREPRVAVLRRAIVHSEGQGYAARIRNLSSGGALMEIDSNARLRNTVEIELNDTDRLIGEIRWAKDRRCGVAFANRIDVERIVRSRAMDYDRSGESGEEPRRVGGSSN